MVLEYILALSGIGFAGIAAYIWTRGYLLDRSVARSVSRLAGEARAAPGGPFRYRDLEGLPAPVARYLKNVLEEGLSRPKIVRLTQSGLFRMREDAVRWQRFEAAQYFSAMPVGFVWDARIRIAPLVRVRVVDTYHRGVGAMRGRVLNIFSVVDEAGSPELAAGALMRYLSESPWFPFALLPGPHLKWRAIDDRTAEATLADAGREVTMTFHFNDADELARASAERYRFIDGSYRLTRWTVLYRDYRRVDGLRIPREGSVEWSLVHGSFEYCRVRVLDAAYQ